MNQKVKNQSEKTVEKDGFITSHHRKFTTPTRKKIRQILRSMLPMEEELRQLKEEQSLLN